ncbi:acetyltransferase, GNAT family [Bacteriovorax sp. Seq25_V]|nr:acetyltransferase, GNAT family [Bacteriovorax sp. Seq25_V]
MILTLPSVGSEDQIVEFYKENENFLAPWDPKKPDGFYTQEFWREKNLQAIREFENQKSLRLNIFLKSSNELIGMANFTGFERGPFQCCRLGYKLGQKFEGQGLMTEALEESIRYIFDELNFHRIEANYIPSNERSGNVLKRLGFTEHGVAENYLLIAGKWQDHVLTSKTNASWKDLN